MPVAGQVTDKRPLEEFEFRLLMQRMVSHWRLVLWTQWETGERIQEVLNLKRADVLPNSYLRIHRLKKHAGDPTSEALLWIPPALSAALTAHLATHRGPWLFSSKWGQGHRAYSYDAADDAYKAASRLAGLRPITTHNVRRGFGRRLAKADLGVSELQHRKLIQHALGHNSPKTVDVYFRPTDEDLAEVMQRLARTTGAAASRP